MDLEHSPHHGEDSPAYVISIAARLSGLHPQTLRQYDRLGLVTPGRAPGRGRRYSARDISALRQVQRLTAEGVSLSAVRRILQLEDEVVALSRRVRELEAALDQPPLPRYRPPARTPNLPALPVVASTALVRWRPVRRRATAD